MICYDLEKCANYTLEMKKYSECANDGSDCVQSCDKRSLVKCEENGMIYILENTSRNLTVLYHVDGGIIKNDTSIPEGIQKCDFMLLLKKPNNGKEVILVELKGKDYLHAIEQISSTVSLFKDFFNKCSNVYARIVISGAQPKLNTNPKYVKLLKLIKNTYHGNLKIKERYFTEKDTALMS